MAKRRMMAGVATPMVLALASCSPGASSGLPDGDIRKALADKLDRPSCFTDTEFTAFPIEPPKPIIGNDHPNFDALVIAGLATKTGKVYALTPAGRAAWRADRNGFCYSDGYEIVKVLDVAPIPDAASSQVADKGWNVTLSIAQKPVAAWAHTPAVGKRAIDQTAFSTVPKTYHVVLAHFRGEEGIRRNDPNFTLPSAFSY